MNKNQTDSTTETTRGEYIESTKAAPVRPALIVSRHIVSEYAILLEHLLAGLADQSIPTAVVCPPESNVENIIPPSVQVIRYPAFNLPLMGGRNRKILIEQLEQFRPTVFHCLSETKAQLAEQLSGQMDMPYLLTVGSLQKKSGQIPISSKYCTKITAHTGSITDNLKEIYPEFAGRIEQVNIGAFVEDSCGCFSSPGRLASMVVTYHSDDAGDFEKLFDAVRHLAIDGYEFMLVMTAGGRAEGRLRKLLDQMKISHLVVIVPRFTPRRCVLAAGDIYIQPQPSDAFNPLLLEAMSIGTAVAGCRGGVDDLIIEGVTGVVFDPNDQRSIYGTLQELLDRQDWARQLAAGGQEYIRENHSVSKMVAAFIAAYHTGF